MVGFLHIRPSWRSCLALHALLGFPLWWGGKANYFSYDGNSPPKKTPKLIRHEPAIEDNTMKDNPALDGWTEVDGSSFDTVAQDSIKSVTSTEIVCNYENNVVLPRHDGASSDYTEHREYSMTIERGQNDQKKCSSVSELLTAVKFGRRSWPDGKPDENKPSKFVPQGCDFIRFDSKTASEVLKMPAKISLDGDSHTRHMIVGLQLILTGNFYDGGIGHVNEWQKCTCDGQFSEALSCRGITNLEVPGVGETIHGAEEPSIPTPSCNSNNQSIIFWLQGAGHYTPCSPEAPLREYFRPMIAKIRSAHAACDAQPTILVSAWNTQSRILDQRYPCQSREHGAQSNQRLAEEYAEDKHVHVVDFQALTQEAQTSDGYHYLTDVNVAKADILLTLIALISEPAKQLVPSTN